MDSLQYLLKECTERQHSTNNYSDSTYTMNTNGYSSNPFGVPPSDTQHLNSDTKISDHQYGSIPYNQALNLGGRLDSLNTPESDADLNSVPKIGTLLRNSHSAGDEVTAASYGATVNDANQLLRVRSEGDWMVRDGNHANTFTRQTTQDMMESLSEIFPDDEVSIITP